MRAVLVEQFSQVESLRILDIPDPEVTSGEVLVQVKAAGLGFVHALKIAGLYQTKDPLPFVPGMEFSGIVCRLGDRVSHLKVGDRVCGVARRGATCRENCGAGGRTIAGAAKAFHSLRLLRFRSITSRRFMVLEIARTCPRGNGRSCWERLGEPAQQPSKSAG